MNGKSLQLLEESVARDIEKSLRPLLNISDFILNHSPWVVEFSKEQQPSAAALVQHMLLKQALNSLRATVLLTTRGYTSQAGTVASSLFETRLYSNFILDRNEKAEQFMRHDSSQDFVWPLRTMMHEEATRNLQGKKLWLTEKQIADETKLIHAGYLFLCALKHSNPIPLHHIVMGREPIVASAVKPQEYLVAASPDSREEDLPVKATILAISNNATFFVARNAGLTVWSPEEKYQGWIKELMDHWLEAVDISKSVMSKWPHMPFPTIPRSLSQQKKRVRKGTH